MKIVRVPVALEERLGEKSAAALLREQMCADRVELLKWAFAFWVGQLVSVVGLVALLLRGR